MDVAVFVQSLIYSAEVNRFAGENLAQRSHAFGRGQGVEKMQMPRATLLKQLTGRHGAAAGSQHGITDHYFITPQARRQFFEVTFGLQRRLITRHAEIAKARLGN